MSIASTMNSFIQSMRCTNPPPVINAGGSATLVTDLTGTSRNIIGSSNQQQGRKWLIAETFVQQTVSLVQTKRHIRSSQSQSAQEPVPWTSAFVEMESNTDISVLGQNFITISYTQRSEEVFCIFPTIHSWTDCSGSYGIHLSNIRTTSGQTFILIINEALYYGTKWDHPLFNQDQIRKFKITIFYMDA